MKNILFVCSQNKLRSRADVEVRSAGTNHDAENPLDGEQVEGADIIIAMERAHRNKIQKRFKSALGNARIVVLDIPGNYEFMDPNLIRLLKARVARFLPTVHEAPE